MEIEDFAREIGREWHIGTDRKGLVYVASISQRKQRMEVAANLEGVLTDIITHEIMDHLKPFMKKMDYAGALRNMVSEIGTRLQSEQAATNQSPAQAGQGQAAQEQAPATTEIPDQTSEQSQSTGFSLFSGFPFFFLLVFLTIIIRIAIRMIRGLPLFPRTVSSNYSPDSGLSYSSSDSSGDSGSSDSSDSSSSSDSGFDGGGSSNDW